MSENGGADQMQSRAAARNRRLIVLAAVVLALALASGIWRWTTGDTIRTTDDAYVGGHVVAVTPQVPGTVIWIGADNADRVTAGSALVVIDPSDARVELAAAEAALARAVRNVRGLVAGTTRADAEVRRAEVALETAQADYRERAAIEASGALRGEDIRHSRDATRIAAAALEAARHARAQAQAQTAGAAPGTHPEVAAAVERVRAAALALERTRIAAPVAGMIAQRTVQMGRRVMPGERLMAVVPLDRLWVDANFKEVQLDGVCPGQPATVEADIYGDRVVYHGRVADIEAGSGAAFALLPPQNASGNWIKVVQRVPVRILLDPAELRRHPLRIGLSAEVHVDTSRCDHHAAAPPPLPEETGLYDAQRRAADREAARALRDSLAKTLG
jgi:membrane fusion protein (multidrug efflux system)